MQQIWLLQKVRFIKRLISCCFCVTWEQNWRITPKVLLTQLWGLSGEDINEFHQFIYHFRISLSGLLQCVSVHSGRDSSVFAVSNHTWQWVPCQWIFKRILLAMPRIPHYSMNFPKSLVCVIANCFPLKFICWNLNPQSLRIWLYLDLVALKR